MAYEIIAIYTIGNGFILPAVNFSTLAIMLMTTNDLVDLRFWQKQEHFIPSWPVLQQH
jgi:hypothetical protein